MYDELSIILEDYTEESELNVLCSLCEYYAKILTFNEYSSYDAYIQEGSVKDFLNKPIGGSNDEHWFVTILAIIPRLITLLVNKIKNFFNKNEAEQIAENVDDLYERIDQLTKRVESLENEQSKASENIKTVCRHIIRLHNQLNNVSSEKPCPPDVEKDILKIYNAINQIPNTFATKSDTAEQMRSVLALAGYVLYTFDLRVYSSFLDEVNRITDDMATIDYDKLRKEPVTIFGKYNIDGIDKMIDNANLKGHYIYTVNDFKNWINVMDKRSSDIRKKLEVVQKTFDSMKEKASSDTSLKDDEKSRISTNITEFSRRVKQLISNISKMKGYYDYDKRRIQNILKEHESSITKLNQGEPVTEAMYKTTNDSLSRYRKSNSIFYYNENNGHTLPVDIRTRLVDLCEKLTNMSNETNFDEYNRTRIELLKMVRLPTDRSILFAYDISRASEGFIKIQIAGPDILVPGVKPGTVLYHTSHIGGLRELKPTFICGKTRKSRKNLTPYFKPETFNPTPRIYFNKGNGGSYMGGSTVYDDMYVYKYIVKPGDKFYRDWELNPDGKQTAGFIVTNHPLPVEDVTDQFR